MELRTIVRILRRYWWLMLIPPLIAAAITVPDLLLASELTVNALTAWVQTASFRQEVAAQLPPEVNITALGIAADNERSVGQLELRHPDSDHLAVIAAVALDVLQTRNQVYFPQVGSAPAAVTLLDEPVIVPIPPSLPNRFAPLIRIGLGLFVGLGLAFLAHYLDPTLRHHDELESLGLTVIATIPRN
jgi:capsular polysaccharide biosynthesis protein